MSDDVQLLEFNDPKFPEYLKKIGDEIERLNDNMEEFLPEEDDEDGQ